MIRQVKQKNTDRRGAAMVELALVLPIFFAVVFGIIEFGRAMMVSQIVTNAAREGARMAILDDSTNQEVSDWVEQFLDDALGLDKQYVTTTITVTAAPGNDNPANILANTERRDLCKIQVSVPFDKVSLLPGDYLNGKNLVGECAMRHE
jgi:Flp pilus assembly protein TadG